MPGEKPSRTAEWVALVRAAEQRRPAEERVVDDPFAAPFLAEAGSPLVAGGVSGPIARTAVAAFGLPLVGLAQFTLVRHRVLDELLLDEARAGAAQAVILGAGYDARAYRFAPGTASPGPARFFEVDHPSLSTRKRAIVAKTLGAPPAHVRYVTVDFLKEKLTDRLVAEGFDRAARTVWIWEGVTMYLTREAVLATLRAIRDVSAPGSALGFDVWRRPRLAPIRNLGARALLRAMEEPLLSWFEAGEGPGDLLRASGFEPLFDHGPHELQALYRRFAPRRRGRVPPTMQLVAARVP
jgi:methyltransferase (TIGR00027 family)